MYHLSHTACIQEGGIPRSPLDASEESPTVIEYASRAQPRHGGGMGRRDPPPSVPVTGVYGVPNFLLLLSFFILPAGSRPIAPATRKDSQNSSPIAKNASKTAKMASKMPPRRPRSPKMASKTVQRCFRHGQDGLKRAQDGPKIDLRRLKMDSRWPKRPPRRPKRAPRGSPRGHQEA